MLYLDQSGQEIGQTRECPDCKKSTMALEAVNPAVFLGGTFARYQCGGVERKSSAVFFRR
jgi:hypothetical protein